MSRDEATGETSIQRVVQTFKKRANRLVKLRFSNGENIEATEEHPFYVPKRGFTAAKLLKVGALVATLSGPAAKVEAVSIVEKSVPVYNFEVENTHTYFVGKSRLWVHNQCAFLGQPLLNGTKIFFTKGKRWILSQGDNNGTYGWNHIYRRHIDLNDPVYGINGTSIIPRSHFDPRLNNDDIIELMEHTISHGKKTSFPHHDVWQVRANWKKTGHRDYKVTIIREGANPHLLDHVRTFHPIGLDNF